MSVASGDIKTIRNAAITVAYRVIGPTSRDAPTICLIPSTGRGPDDFDHLAAELAGHGIRSVLPWPRGIGPSIGDTRDTTFHDYAEDAAAALEVEAGTGGAFVAGHAYGCWIARTIAATRPELITGIVLIAAAAGKWPPELSQAIDTAMKAEEPEQRRLDALRLAFFADGNDPRPWLSGWYPELAASQRAARSRTDRKSWWHSGDAPILDLVGLQDPFRPAAMLDFYVKEFAARVSQKTINGASHALPDEKPKEAAEIVSRWINAHRAT